MTLLVDASAVRDYLQLNAVASTSQYSDQTISSNILAAQSALEQACNRYFVPRTFTVDAPWKTTTYLRAIVSLPGFRTFDTVTWGGSTMVEDQSFWALPDAQQSGVFTGIQFRAMRADPNGAPWWYADSNWWDKALDSPFYPGNYGGGYYYTSMPNDLRIAGDAGYDPTLDQGDQGYPPFALLHAIKVLASFFTMRPASILADVAITAQGGVLTYSQMPAEVAQFIAAWRAGQQIVSVG